MIETVKEILRKPKDLHTLSILKDLALKLCNYNMNIKCSDCINEAVFLLGNWLRKQESSEFVNDVIKKSMNGEYYLKPLVLYVQVYKSDNEERNKELEFCLKKNKELGYFYEIIEVNERLTFSEMFALSKKHPDKINVFANSDIYFDETILFARWIKPNQCYALSRWDIRENGLCVLFNRKDSQDAWIFNGEVKQLNYSDFQFGKPGCDNRIAYEIKKAGYDIGNPSKSMHALHLHKTEYRTYTQSEKIPEPYHFILPHL